MRPSTTAALEPGTRYSALRTAQRLEVRDPLYYETPLLSQPAYLYMLNYNQKAQLLCVQQVQVRGASETLIAARYETR